MSRPRLDRRHFLHLLAYGSVGAAGWVANDHLGGPGQPATSVAGRATPTGAGPAEDAAGSASIGVAAVQDRVLVVLELGGGNDGLSTVVPYADGRYHDLRPLTAIAEDRVLAIDDEVGLHPSLAQTAALPFATVEGVGVAKPDFSHFEMHRRWWQADPDGDDRADAGFLGALCDELHVDGAITGVTLG